MNTSYRGDEICSACGSATGHAGYGDGSIGYVDGMIGPLCDDCNHRLAEEVLVDSGLQADIRRLQSLVADAVRNGLVIAQCDLCGAEILSLPRDEHPEGALWCVKCAANEVGGEG